MREFSGFSGILYSLTEWIMRFSVINILWFLINIPIAIILFSLYMHGFTFESVIYWVPLLILMPLLFVPSTVGLFATTRDWVMKKEQHSLTKAYFSHIKMSYKKSFLAGIILTIIWFIWIMDFYFFYNESDLFRIVFLIVGLLLFVYTWNFFSLSAHYEMTNKELLKNTFFVTIGSPLLSFFILISNLLLVYLSMTKLLFLFPFFTGSISAFLSFSAFYRFFLKVEKKALTNKTS